MSKSAIVMQGRLYVSILAGRKLAIKDILTSDPYGSLNPEQRNFRSLAWQQYTGSILWCSHLSTRLFGFNQL